MRKVLVTGATGFVGWHVAKTLVEYGCRVRALVRPGKFVSELDVELVEGDLRNVESVFRAVKGCEWVFHVAADYRLWAPRPHELFETNVQGTKHVLEACEYYGVERVVYTSTVGCIGIPKDGLGDEDTEVKRGDLTGAYKQSKFLAEQVALDFARKGLPVVVVNPTAPVGDHDFKPTPTGRIILDFLRGKQFAYIDTGLNLVDVDDVAKGHLLACIRGVPGERYILGGENLTLLEVFQKLEKISGRPAPRLRLPYWVAYAFSWVDSGVARLTGREPRAPLDAVRMAKKKMFVSTRKAEEKLGYRAGPVEAALARAVEWFQAEGYV